MIKLNFSRGDNDRNSDINVGGSFGRDFITVSHTGSHFSAIFSVSIGSDILGFSDITSKIERAQSDSEEANDSKSILPMHSESNGSWILSAPDTLS